MEISQHGASLSTNLLLFLLLLPCIERNLGMCVLPHEVSPGFVGMPQPIVA